MAQTQKASKRSKPRTPILVRHAVSLCLVFTAALVLSYFAGQSLFGQLQLGKLNHADRAVFDEGVAFVITEAGESEAVTREAIDAVNNLSDIQRSADLLLAVMQSHAQREDVEEPTIPSEVSAAVGPLMRRMSAEQAIGLYDGVVQIAGIDAVASAKTLLESIDPETDTELLRIVDLLDTRLIWSRQWVPTDLWVRWLFALADSPSELTQFNTAKRLGELPEAVDDQRVRHALGKLSQSAFDTVRNRVLFTVAGYAAIAEDPVAYEQIIFLLGEDANSTIARRAWMVVGHLNPFSGFAVNWKDADPFVAEAMLWAAVKTNPERDKPALNALRTPGYEAAGALAMNEWRRPQVPVSDADLVFQKLIKNATEQDMVPAWRSILASKDFINAEASVIDPYGYRAPTNESMLPLYHAGHAITAASAPQYDRQQFASSSLLLAYLEGVFDHSSSRQSQRDAITPVTDWPTVAKLLVAAHGIDGVNLDVLIGELPLHESVLLDLFTLALTHANDDTLGRFIRSAHPEKVTMAAMAAAITNRRPTLIDGINTAFLQKRPDITTVALRAMTDDELAELGLRRIDALPALLDAAASAPPSANREAEAKLLQLAMWVRGDLGDDFTPTAEAMLLDDDLPTSTVLMALLHMKRPIALDYLFGDLVTPRLDLHKLFIQQRYWHVFRRFVDTSDLTLWLWGDPEAQAFQLEAMRQWYAVNRWQIGRGAWPEPQR
jgi:hypothetical protein